MDSTAETPTEFSYDRDPNSLASQLVASTEAAHKTVTAPTTVTVRGINLVVAPGVFNPAHSNVGDLLAEYLSSQITLDTRVLDMGTGSGFQALCAAQKSSNVWACDKQAEAVQCARDNITRNNAVERITVLESDLFGSIP